MEAASAHDDANLARARSERNQTLARLCRGVATAAAEQSRGGVALVFALAVGESGTDAACTLRAAAGFAEAPEAVAAAEGFADSVRCAVETQYARDFEPGDPLGEHADGAVRVIPLSCEGRAYGALVVAGPGDIDAATSDALRSWCEDLALRFDHAHLADAAWAGSVSAPDSGPVEEQSEEILKLSEALFAQDIELLRNNEKLTKIEKLKNDFIEKMSRELRTPLNGIIEAIISVLTGENDSLSDGAKSTLRSALDDGTAFLRTLQNILDLWRIKQGELPVEMREVNFREVIEESVFSVQDSIGPKSLQIQTDIQNPLPKVRTDLTKVNQILFLLLDNAVKFTPSGQVDISVRVEGERLYCEVSDTGIGICQDDQQLMFDEFFQVDDTPSGPRGAGLGLALVRDLIVLLDGGISVTSKVGRGSTFAFDIPVKVCD